MNFKLISSVLITILLGACNVENQTPIENSAPKEVEKRESFEINNESKVLRFNQNNGQLYLHLDNPDQLSFDNYFDQLANDLKKAKAAKIKLDSVNKIFMIFFLNLEMLEIEFGLIEEVQNELKNRITEKRKFLNHDLIGSHLAKSKSIISILNLLDIDPERIRDINVEKCRSEPMKGENDKSVKYKLFCAHLIIDLS
ncbi:MAG: hypothetical protein AB8G15_20080 [Saprospiraceae bacterium]